MYRAFRLLSAVAWRFLSTVHVALRDSTDEPVARRIASAGVSTEGVTTGGPKAIFVFLGCTLLAILAGAAGFSVDRTTAGRGGPRAGGGGTEMLPVTMLEVAGGGLAA